MRLAKELLEQEIGHRMRIRFPYDPKLATVRSSSRATNLRWYRDDRAYVRSLVRALRVLRREADAQAELEMMRHNAKQALDTIGEDALRLLDRCHDAEMRAIQLQTKVDQLRLVLLKSGTCGDCIAAVREALALR